MNNRSRSALFLMEQLIVIAVFAICASACVKIFVNSYSTAVNTKDINNALLIAESGAECFKAVGGDVFEIADVLSGSVMDGTDAVEVYYNKEYRVCPEDSAVYVMRLDGRYAEDLEALKFGDISVRKITGEEIIAFTAAVRCGTDE